MQWSFGDLHVLDYETQDGDIMEAMALLDYSWEGHGLQQGDVITAIREVMRGKRYFSQ